MVVAFTFAKQLKKKKTVFKSKISHNQMPMMKAVNAFDWPHTHTHMTYGDCQNLRFIFFFLPFVRSFVRSCVCWLGFASLCAMVVVVVQIKCNTKNRIPKKSRLWNICAHLSVNNTLNILTCGLLPIHVVVLRIGFFSNRWISSLSVIVLCIHCLCVCQQHPMFRIQNKRVLFVMRYGPINKIERHKAKRERETNWMSEKERDGEKKVVHKSKWTMLNCQKNISNTK